MSSQRQVLGDSKRTTMFPSLKKTFYENSRLAGRNANELSLDEKAYRMTSNQLLRGLLRHNETDLKKLRDTFVKAGSGGMGVGVGVGERRRVGQYVVMRQIGKGGFAQVWEVEDSAHRRYALKEYQLQNSVECFQNEAAIGQYFFEQGRPRAHCEQHAGAAHLIPFIDKFRIGKQGYILQPLSQHNLSKLISDIQGVFHNNERVYEVRFKDFHATLVSKGGLKQLMIEICQAVSLINSAGFIHCDLKLENIMVEFQGDTPSVKIIDFGSTFELKYGLPKVTITPEYMPPELLSMLESGSQNYEVLRKVDVWSVGCILLQILTGMPLWFRYKCRVEVKGRPTLQLGVFALTGRDYQKIIKKQRELTDNIHKLPITHKELEKYRPLLKKILTFNATARPTIDECLELFEELE